MSRLDDIYDEISELYKEMRLNDGSQSYGKVTPSMTEECRRLQEKINKLIFEKEQLERRQ